MHIRCSHQAKFMPLCILPLQTIYAGLVFNVPEQATTLPSDIEYTIRINGSYLPSSNDNDSPVDKSSCRAPNEGSYQFPTACPTQKYLTSGGAPNSAPLKFLSRFVGLGFCSSGFASLSSQTNKDIPASSESPIPGDP